MGAMVDEHDLARILPGSWTIAASNLPVWLNGERLSPHFSYELVSEDPLVLVDDVSYATPDGEEKHIVGQNAWGADGFRGRGKGLQRVFPTHWAVSGVSEDGSIAVLRHSKSVATVDGIDIIVRDGAEPSAVRATIARATEEFGLTPEDFGSLSWLLQAY